MPRWSFSDHYRVTHVFCFLWETPRDVLLLLVEHKTGNAAFKTKFVRLCRGVSNKSQYDLQSLLG